MPRLAAEGFRAHAVVTDPPYHLTSGNVTVDWGAMAPGANGSAKGPTNRAGRGHKAGFMGKAWDGGDVAFRPETWRAVFDCMLPGAHLVAFGGTRTFHRMVCAIEDAGFEVRDLLMWVYGSGFPKSLDVSKAIDRAAGAEREVVCFDADKLRPNRLDRGYVNSSGGSGFHADNGATITAPATPEAAAWVGWGTALKPGYEPIVLARKPLEGTVAANVLRHGCGAINVDASRVPTDENLNGGAYAIIGGRSESSSLHGGSGMNVAGKTVNRDFVQPLGRWPANLLHDGSPEVEQAFAAFGERASGTDNGQRGTGGIWQPSSGVPCGPQYGDTGSASRFFYCSKATKADRCDSKHPTVKPLKLMEWLVRLVTPPGGTILDPFAGTGSTGLAADQLGMHAVLIERDETYAGDAKRKIEQDAPLFGQVDLDAAYQRQPRLFEDAAD